MGMEGWGLQEAMLSRPGPSRSDIFFFFEGNMPVIYQFTLEGKYLQPG